MKLVIPDQCRFSEVKNKTVIVTGAASGIGAATARNYHQHGANVVLADLEESRKSAEALIANLGKSARALFVPVDVTVWKQMVRLFDLTEKAYGSIDIVIANAGIMETSLILEQDEVDEMGILRESVEANRVIDTNLKGALNTLRLALFHMKHNPPSIGGSCGSVVLISSTSGYFGGTGAAAYVSSKHGVMGLLRASQKAANKAGVRVNCIAPNFTDTRLTRSFAEIWHAAGMEYNTPQHVANIITQISVDSEQRGACYLVAGNMLREMEHTRVSLLPDWLGWDVVQFMDKIGSIIANKGQLLPKIQQQARL